MSIQILYCFEGGPFVLYIECVCVCLWDVFEAVVSMLKMFVVNVENDGENVEMMLFCFFSFS